MTDSHRHQPPRSRYTLRLTFAYQGDEVRLVRSERVAMITPPSLPYAPHEDQAGYWFEVHGAGGELLYHRALHSPVRTDIEVFSDDPKQTIARAPNPNPSGEFTVLVPDLPEADSFALHGPPAEPGLRAAQSGRLLSYSFDELRNAGRVKTEGRGDEEVKP